MPGPQLPPLTDLKKDWKFYWYIGYDTPNGGLPESSYAQFNVLMNHVLTSYVSQMAESVDLPEDELSTDDYKVGGVGVPVATGFRMGDITVTYLEDTNDAIYNFHRSWQSFIRRGDTFCIEPLYPYSLCARMITFDDTLTTAEYIAFAKLTERIDKTVFSTNKALNVISSYVKTDGLYIKPISIYNYPHIFPVKIKRTQYNKGGQNLFKVTVTYKRIPEIKKTPSYMRIDDNLNFFVTNPLSRGGGRGL